MSFQKLDNCARCDALFVRTVRDICPKCYKEVEEEYTKCAQFLRKRENRGANIQQLSEATGVSVRQITRFIKEGRISTAGNPNLSYPCENCGTPIISGHLCEACASGLRREMEQDQDVKQRLAEEEKRQNAEATYKIRRDE